MILNKFGMQTFPAVDVSVKANLLALRVPKEDGVITKLLNGIHFIFWDNMRSRLSSMLVLQTRAWQEEAWPRIFLYLSWQGQFYISTTSSQIFEAARTERTHSRCWIVQRGKKEPPLLNRKVRLCFLLFMSIGCLFIPSLVTKTPKFPSKNFPCVSTPLNFFLTMAAKRGFPLPRHTSKLALSFHQSNKKRVCMDLEMPQSFFDPIFGWLVLPHGF